MINYGYGIDLGSIDACHLDRLRRWRNDPRIWSWCRQNNLISELDQKRWHERQSQDDSVRMFAVWTKNVTDLVGCCGLTSIDHVNQRAEFSLYIGHEFYRLGFGKRALKTLLDYAFKELNLNLVWGETFEGNPALEMFIKLGMVKEGTRRRFYYKNGKYLDAHLISITKEEWKCSQSH